MTTSNYMPDLMVEVGAAGTDSARTASSGWSWRDVSADVELQHGVDIQWGRQDEIAQADPNSLSLTFRPSSFETFDYGPGVVLEDSGYEVVRGVPIRVRAVPAGSVGNYLSANAASMEVNVSDWSAGGSVPPSLSWSNTRAQVGTRSLLITWGAGGVLPLAQTTVTGLVIGRTYTVSAYAYVPTGDPSVVINIPGHSFGAGMETKNAFTRFSHTFTATASSHLVQIWPTVSPSAGDQCWVDAVQVWHGSEPVTFATTQLSNFIEDRFTGFVDTISVAWPDGRAEEPAVTVNALSRLGVVARARNIQDATSAAVIAAGATSYWPMSEETPGSGITHPTSPPWFSDDRQLVHVDNVQGVNLVRYGWPPMDENFPAPDGLNVGTVFNRNLSTIGAATLQIEGRVSEIPVNTAWSASVLIRVPPDPAATSPNLVPLAGYNATEALWTSAYRLEWLQNGDVFTWAIFTYASGVATDVFVGSNMDLRDGRWHMITLTVSSAANPVLRAYVDDVQVASGTATISSIPIRAVTTGDYLFVGGTGYKDPNPRHEVGRLAVYDGTLLSAGNVSDLYSAIFIGTTADTVDERLQTWFDYAGMPAADLTITDAGDTPLLVQPVAGSSPLTLMQEVAAADRGVLYDTRGTSTAYVGRRVRLGASLSAAVTFDADTQEVNADLSVVADAAAVVNDVTVKAADNSFSIPRSDTDSIDLYGSVGEETTLITGSYPHLVGFADWQLFVGGITPARAPSLSVDLTLIDTSRHGQILELDVGSLVEIDGLPANLPGLPTQLFIEGATETWGPESCRITFNVTDAAPELGTFILNSLTLGTLNGATYLG